MQRSFSALKQVFHNRLPILGTIVLSFVSSLFVFFGQPSLAAPISPEGQKLIQQEKNEKTSQSVKEDRSRAYAEQVEAAKDIDKVYENNAKVYNETQPNIVEKTAEGAENLVKKVTRND